MKQSSLQQPLRVLGLLFLLFAGAFYAKAFLVPFVLAALLAMLFTPLSAWLEARRFPRPLAVLVCVLCVLALLAGVVALLYWQIADLAKDASNIEKNLTEQVTRLRSYLAETMGVSQQQQQQMMQGGGQSKSKLPTLISGLLAGVGSLLTDTILFFVYLFLLLHLRSHLRKAMLLLVPAAHRSNAAEAMHQSRKVVQQYLLGMSIMIGCLWVLYGIGFSIVGVRNALFFAVLCGLLEIIPFIGNLTGTLFTMITVFAQGGDTNMVLGVLITYAVVQFVQTYLLEPLVVGAEVRINPLATIVGIVVAELVWGVPGMVLAIPLMGIAKIVCDRVEPWKPVGVLLGAADKKDKKKKQD